MMFCVYLRLPFVRERSVSLKFSDWESVCRRKVLIFAFAFSLLIILAHQGIEWVIWATSERWKHACEDLEPQIFLVAQAICAALDDADLVVECTAAQF